jgi:hypothetical protein
MSIFIMASGRLKETPRFVEGKTSVTLITNDASNRAQRIVVTSTDTATSNALQNCKAGDIVTVNGEATFDTLSVVCLKARRVQVLENIDPASVA